MVDVNAKYWKKIKPEYRDLFPQGEPDKAWNGYEEKQEIEIIQRIENPEISMKIEGFIQLINLCLEYNALPKNPHNHDPNLFWSWNYLKEMQAYNADFKYYNTFMYMSFPQTSNDHLHFMLRVLLSVRDEIYTPLDDFSKARIRRDFKSFSLNQEHTILGTEEKMLFNLEKLLLNRF